MNSEDEKIFDQYQPLLKKIIFKFVGKRQTKNFFYKNTNKYDNDWLDFSHRGIYVDDLFQFGKIILIDTINFLSQKNEKIKDPTAYLYMVLYQEIKKYIIKQKKFIELDDIEKEYKNPFYISNIEDCIYNKEIKEIMKKQIINPILADLNYKKEYILKHLYGFENSKIKTIKEIAKFLGIGENKVKFLKKTMIENIKKNSELMEKLKN